MGQIRWKYAKQSIANQRDSTKNLCEICSSADYHQLSHYDSSHAKWCAVEIAFVFVLLICEFYRSKWMAFHSSLSCLWPPEGPNSAFKKKCFPNSNFAADTDQIVFTHENFSKFITFGRCIWKDGKENKYLHVLRSSNGRFCYSKNFLDLVNFSISIFYSFIPENYAFDAFCLHMLRNQIRETENACPDNSLLRTDSVTHVLTTLLAIRKKQ